MADAAELLIVRSLTDSDLGIFAAHRAAASSKQRALNINAPAAQQLLSRDLYESGGDALDCLTVFDSVQERSKRSFAKIHKNWRLGGQRLAGRLYAQIDSADFAIIRSVKGNDGSFPISLTFVARATDAGKHARLGTLLTARLNRSVATIDSSDAIFSELVALTARPPSPNAPAAVPGLPAQKSKISISIAPMPRDEKKATRRERTIKEKLRSPSILERMFRASSDLSAPAQVQFMQNVEMLASQLREVLLETGGIIKLGRDHGTFWPKVAGTRIGFVDGGLANLSSLGSAPIACRVGGYSVVPGQRGPDREAFTTLKLLISELYAAENGSVYDGGFPDVGALRDAARISIEAAGSVRILSEFPDFRWVFQHGALVNPVSRYTDVMKHERVAHRFPDFSSMALKELLPANENNRVGRDANFVSVHLRQLELLQQSSAVVCGVIERESTTSSVIKAILNSLHDDEIAALLPTSPAVWKEWFRTTVDPADDDDGDVQRITDSLLFRCVLEPGEVLRPVAIDRNEMRRAPKAWHDIIGQYPKPIVSYVQPTEWNAPIRIEMFEKDAERFEETAALIIHCAMLLPQYAFPVGLDIVDKFAKIPNWMSRPINTHTAVQALRRALDLGDDKLFDNLRRILCGTSRDWLLRPGAMR
ncbi:hypothetical protein V1292_001435 [Bradyrhizobium sp. AZCC 1719]|uniref:DNA double-strand break repair nuclease NurA n=1 Tax=Bradyrhizobium sp. AZCC 1719 TaxID=3117028 RepID=UPI002FF3DB83